MILSGCIDTMTIRTETRQVFRDLADLCGEDGKNKKEDQQFEDGCHLPYQEEKFTSKYKMKNKSLMLFYT